MHTINRNNLIDKSYRIRLIPSILFSLSLLALTACMPVAPIAATQEQSTADGRDSQFSGCNLARIEGCL